MGYEQRYTLEEAKAELYKQNSGHYTVLIQVLERPAGAPSDRTPIEHLKIALRASTLEGAVSKAQDHLITEMESIDAEAGSSNPEHNGDPRGAEERRPARPA